MPKHYAIDCSKYPSDVECDLKITGSNRKAVLDAAYLHAIGPVHKHDASDPDLKANLERMIEEELEEVPA